MESLIPFFQHLQPDFYKYWNISCNDQYWKNCLTWNIYSWRIFRKLKTVLPGFEKNKILQHWSCQFLMPSGCCAENLWRLGLGQRSAAGEPQKSCLLSLGQKSQAFEVVLPNQCCKKKQSLAAINTLIRLYWNWRTH